MAKKSAHQIWREAKEQGLNKIQQKELFVNEGIIVKKNLNLDLIKKAWGRFYNPNKYHYSINGWRSLHEVEETEMYEMLQELKLEFGENRFRPVILNQINQ